MRIYVLHRRSLSRCFGMPGFLSGAFSFGQESAAHSSSCLLPEVGEVGFPNHGKGSPLLPLVRVRIVFLLCILFPGFVFSRLHPGVILEKEFRFFVAGLRWCLLLLLWNSSVAYLCSLWRQEGGESLSISPP